MLIPTDLYFRLDTLSYKLKGFKMDLAWLLSIQKSQQCNRLCQNASDEGRCLLSKEALWYIELWTPSCIFVAASC